MDWRELELVAVLIAAAFAARLAVLFLLVPLLSLARLTQPVSTVYKLAIAWGGLRGALTLVLALSVTENPLLPGETRHFVAVLATGLVLFTLLVNGTTLRPLIRLLGLDRLSPIDRLLRDRVLELSYAETSEMIVKTAEAHDLHPRALASALAPYQAWTKAAGARDAAEEMGLTEHERMTVALIALGNQERMLVLETLSRRAASPAALQMLMRNADALVEGARSGGRLGYKRAAEAALAFPLAFRAAYFVYRRFGVRRFLADRLGDRFETLLVTRLLIQDLARGGAQRSRSIFGERVGKLIDSDARGAPRADEVGARRLPPPIPGLCGRARSEIPAPVGAAPRARALRVPVRRGPDPRGGLPRPHQQRRARAERRGAAALRHRPRHRPARRAPRPVRRARRRAPRTRAEAAAGALLVPNELIVRKGDPGDAVFFIASGAAEVVMPDRRIPLGSGDVFGEMALLSGAPRQADVRAVTYCRLLVLRKADFDRFMRDNRDVRLKIHEIAQTRTSANRSGAAAAV